MVFFGNGYLGCDIQIQCLVFCGFDLVWLGTQAGFVDAVSDCQFSWNGNKSHSIPFHTATLPIGNCRVGFDLVWLRKLPFLMLCLIVNWQLQSGRRLLMGFSSETVSHHKNEPLRGPWRREKDPMEDIGFN